MKDPALTLTPEELRIEGFKVLCRELGAAAAMRFVVQYERGRGDYSHERHALIDKVTFDETQRLIEEAARHLRGSPKRERRSSGSRSRRRG